MGNYTLLTGSTGLLGGHLLRDLLLAGRRVVVIARPTRRESVTERIESILQRWENEGDAPLPRPVCLEGDLCEEFLGLDEGDRQWLAKHVSSVIHSAAALKFNEEPNGEPWRTNVGGTRNVIQLCRNTKIRQMHYVSTAYVCGTRSDRIMEDELDLGQSFRNDYERSKLEAETLVREADCFDRVTVYRPAVIAGDSQTGYTNTYHGLFMYLQLMSVLARNTEPDAEGIRHTTLQLNITGDEPRNVIPVDWASAVIAHLFGSPAAHGQTFHLAPQVRMTARQMIEAGYTFFNSTGVEFVGSASDSTTPEGGMERDAFENSTMYREYEAIDPEFDTTNLDRLAGHLPCPKIDEAMLHRFLKYGEKDRWGKRRPPKSEVAIDIQQHLEQIADANCQTAVRNKTIVGLDIRGPGGGQWSVVLAEKSLVAVERGLSPDCSTVWSMTLLALAGATCGPLPPTQDTLVAALFPDGLPASRSEAKTASIIQ